MDNCRERLVGSFKMSYSTKILANDDDDDDDDNAGNFAVTSSEPTSYDISSQTTSLDESACLDIASVLSCHGY